MEMTEREFDALWTLVPGVEETDMLDWDEARALAEKVQAANPDLNVVEIARLIWTWVDGDEGETCLVAGIHFVNRFAYAVTTEPWMTGDEVMVLEAVAA